MYSRIYIYAFLHNLCHESSLTVGIDLIYYQCSGVVDHGTRYIMPNTTFCIFVICSGYAIYFVYEYCDHV